MKKYTQSKSKKMSNRCADLGYDIHCATQHICKKIEESKAVCPRPGQCIQRSFESWTDISIPAKKHWEVTVDVFDFEQYAFAVRNDDGTIQLDGTIFLEFDNVTVPFGKIIPPSTGDNSVLFEKPLGAHSKGARFCIYNPRDMDANPIVVDFTGLKHVNLVPGNCTAVIGAPSVAAGECV